MTKKQEIFKCFRCGCRLPRAERATISGVCRTYRIDENTGKEIAFDKPFIYVVCGEYCHGDFLDFMNKEGKYSEW